MKTPQEMYAWYMMPQEELLRTPTDAVEARRPAAEELQHELTMTANVLRSAQSRLADEREQRLRARAAEELAMIDLKRARDEAKALEEGQREADRELSKALMQQRVELEAQLQQQEDEQELKIAAIQVEQERQAERLRMEHEENMQELADRLEVALRERDELIHQQELARQAEAERLEKMTSEQAALAMSEAQKLVEEEKEKRVAHLQQMGVRRLIQQGLARGWTAWRDGHREYQRKRRLLGQAAGRLAKPKLTAAFVHWQHDWEAEIVRQRTKTSAQILEEEKLKRIELEIELQKAHEERDAARSELEVARGQGGTLQREAERLLEEEREKRVAHLQQLGVRRLIQQGLARGWNAWVDVYHEQKRKQRLLMQSANRLARPKLVASFMQWQSVWYAIQRKRAAMSKEAIHAEQLALQAEQIAALRQSLDECMQELETARADAERERSNRSGLDDEMQRQIEEEREKRVAHLQQIGVRRLIQQGLARGWNAWHDNYSDYQRKKRMLKGAGARLAKPKLVASFVKWRQDWEAEEKEKAQMSQAERLAHEVNKRNVVEAELVQVRKELRDARQAMLEGRGEDAEKQRLMQEELEREREKRVAHLQQLGVRRLMQQGLARGWTAWLDIYEDYVHKKRMLKAAAGRLAKPKLVAAFVHWQRDWVAEEAANAQMTTAQRLAVEASKQAALEEQITTLQEQLRAAQDVIAQLTGEGAEAKQLAEQQLNEEREKRVAHLQQLGVRRLIQQGLARGWNAWYDNYTEYQRKKRMLQGAGARLAKPKLVAAFVHWQRDWEAEEAHKARMSQEERMQAEAAKRLQIQDELQAEVSKLRAELSAARKAMLEGRGAEAERERLMQEELEREREKRVAHLQQLGVRRLMQQGLARGWTAWLDVYEDYVHKQRMLKTAASRLSRPKLVASFVHWQRDWEAEHIEHCSNEFRAAAC